MNFGHLNLWLRRIERIYVGKQAREGTRGDRKLRNLAALTGTRNQDKVFARGNKSREKIARENGWLDAQTAKESLKRRVIDDQAASSVRAPSETIFSSYGK
jgi:hypothetical protein